jgi:predicted nuclease of predicted toxin-antitoxin system
VKVLLDACVGGGVQDALRDAGHDVDWAGDWSEDPGDEQILERAEDSGRIVVTLDRDFAMLAVVRGMEHKGIVRMVGLSSTRQADLCTEVLRRYAEDLEKGAIVTVEPHRVRVRPAQSDS